MTEDEVQGSLASIILPVVGKFLAEACAYRLYEALADGEEGRELLTELVSGYCDREEGE